MIAIGCRGGIGGSGWAHEGHPDPPAPACRAPAIGYAAATAVGSPAPSAQNPNALTDAPGAMRCDHVAGVTVTLSPDCTAVPFQVSRRRDPAGMRNDRVHEVACVVPVLRTVKLRQKPVSQVESRVTVTASAGDPGAGAGDGVGVGVGAGTGLGTGVGAGATGAGAPAMVTVTPEREPEPCTHSPVSWYEPPAGTRAHVGSAMERADPLPETVPFHVLVTDAPAGTVNAMAVGVSTVVPGLPTTNLPHQPPAHCESMATRTVGVPVPGAGAGAGVGVGVGAGAGEGAGPVPGTGAGVGVTAPGA